MANGLLLISFILPAILGLLLPHSASAVADNHLLTGETLDTDGQLQNGRYTLVMKGDCNLVLYNGGWQSNTSNNGRDCKLRLNRFGQLVIRNGMGTTVWTSSSRKAIGNYAAVVHPEGTLSVYGPALFTINPNELASGAQLGNIPMTRNMLFSGQILYRDGRLTAKDYRFVMQGDCNLVLYGGTHGWQSNTHSNSQRYCFLRLTHKGELVIRDDDSSTIWSSGRTSRTGDYVFILQDNGNGVVYGPLVFSTKPSADIEMVATA